MSSQLGSFEKILRVGEGRRMKRLAEQAAYITSIEPEFQELSDEQLRDKTVEFRQRLENGETLEELLFEAFAAVREARLRESDQRMFDVQLMGGIVLHEGDMAVSLDGVVQRSHAYAIVDEVDSILIDEARTPLIISGEPETAAQIYYDFARIARGLQGIPHDPLLKGGNPDADYEYDEKHKTVAPGQASIDAVERALRIESLYDPRNSQLVNHLIQALKAESLYKRDDDYVIQDGEVKIVDEFTGRIMEGRRWSEGLHQAIEAKEGVKIQEENVTLATIDRKR